MGKPRVCVGDARAKVKMIVSAEIEDLRDSVALDQDLGFRNVALGTFETSSEGEGLERARRAAGERVPRWWEGIIAFAVSESMGC